MLGSRKVLDPRWLIACGATWLCLSGCSGKDFATGDASGGTTSSGGTESAGASVGGAASGASGGTDSAGEATSGGTVAAGGTDGAGGAGGAVASACDCPAGQYCRDGTPDCFDCANFNRLNFTTPERMSTLSDNGQGSHFPRVGSTKTDLLYHFDGAGLRYTADASTSAGSGVMATVASDSGPLLLSSDVTGAGTMLTGFNFLFDRTLNTLRSIQVGQWKDGLLKIEKAPAPWNGDKSDYSVAVALKPTADGIARAFWMSNRNVAKGALMTALLTANAPIAPVPLMIGQPTCAASDADLTPWVTADGKTLLVSHTRLDANCTPNGQLKDIYTAVLQPAAGLPSDAPARPMNDVNSPMNDTEPSFSTDMCELYFASDRDGKYALYRAHRR